MMPINEWNEPNCWLSCITLSGKVKPIDTMLKLEEENIESRPIWKPMHLQPFYEKYEFFSHFDKDDGNRKAITLNESSGPKHQCSSVSEFIFATGVCLPSDTKMTDDDLARVCKAIRALWS
jgi:dTDP-4-amino-4,6-dideoxygalactose transaminase